MRARLLALLLLPVGLFVACGGSSSSTTEVDAGENTALGFIIVSGSGLTLYHLTSEIKGSIKCLDACTEKWPPLTVSGGAKPIAGTGISASDLGAIKRPDGKVQVTYFGKALYRYSRDAKVGDTKGEGVRGVWYAVTPAGEVAKPFVAAQECPPGQGIPQGPGAGDDDDDNTVGTPSDGDGCL